MAPVPEDAKSSTGHSVRKIRCRKPDQLTADGGDVEIDYNEGPYLDTTSFSLYGDQAAAMLALTDGEIDYWVNPLGVSPGLREQGLWQNSAKS